MKFKLFGMEVDCGCDERRKKLTNFWNNQSDEWKAKMAGKQLTLFGWKYSFDENGDVVAEEKA